MNVFAKNIWERYICAIKKQPYKYGFIHLSIFLFIPFLILFLYYLGDNNIILINTKLSIGDALIFYGTFLSFLGTIALGSLALIQNIKVHELNEKISEDNIKLAENNKKNSVLPFIALNKYEFYYTGEVLTSALARVANHAIKEQKSSENGTPSPSKDYMDNMKRIDFKLEQIIFTISENEIHIRSGLTEEQSKKVQYCYSKENTPEGRSVGRPKYLYQKYLLRNCGRGPAINLQCQLTKDETQDNKKIEGCSPPYTITTDYNLDIGFWFDLPITPNLKYTLKFTFYNIYGDKYIQKIPITTIEDGYNFGIFELIQMEEIQNAD